MPRPIEIAAAVIAVAWSATTTSATSPERAPELLRAFGGRCGLVEGHDGFIDLHVWQSDRDAGEVVMVSRWCDRACFKAYMKSADHRISHERIDAGLRSAIKLESIDHMHTYEVVAE